MAPRCIISVMQWLHPKDDERNLIAASFHMMTITMISMSLVDLTWFKISGNVCVPYLTLGQFFWFGFSNAEMDYSEYDCINSTIVNMMRSTILMCFMTILFALLAFFLDIIGPTSIMYRTLRKYAVFGTVLWVVVIIGMAFYIVVLLKDSIAKLYTKADDIVVLYGLGFYLVAAAGGISCLGIIYTLMLSYKSPPYRERDDDRCLIDGFDDGLDTFNSPTPPPPYSLPPPPYSP